MIYFLWEQTSFLCKIAAHNLQWLSVQNHLYTVLYDNLVVLFSSLVINDTQGLTFILADNTHVCHMGAEIVRFVFRPWVDFPKSTWQKYYFHFHLQNSKIQMYWEKERNKPISRRHDISRWYQSRDVFGKTTQVDSDVLDHCGFYS